LLFVPPRAYVEDPLYGLEKGIRNVTCSRNDEAVVVFSEPASIALLSERSLARDIWPPYAPTILAILSQLPDRTYF
jgi:hypothetical protein